MTRRPAKLLGGASPLFLLLFSTMCSSTPSPPPASGDAISSAARNAESELVKARRNRAA
jgi:hypothetical protein